MNFKSGSLQHNMPYYRLCLAIFHDKPELTTDEVIKGLKDKFDIKATRAEVQSKLGCLMHKGLIKNVGLRCYRLSKKDILT